MKILSLFDGISCARVALERAGFEVEKYYASETDKYAIQIAQKNYPDTIQVGDISELKEEDFKDIDLIIGGSPCQDLSVAKNNREGLKGKRSSLFYEYVRLVKEIKPKWWILENVNSMNEASKTTITKVLGENLNMSMYWKPKMIDANLVSAQNRKRLFWTNISPMEQPQDRGIVLADIIHELRGEPVDEKYFVSEETKIKPRTIKNTRGVDQKANSMTATIYKGSQSNGTTCIRVGTIGNDGQGNRVYSVYGKSCTLPEKYKTIRVGGRGSGLNDKHNWDTYQIGDRVRRLTPMECERLQSLDDRYTEGLSDTQRYKCLGNAFNVDVVAHILSFISHPNQIKS